AEVALIDIAAAAELAVHAFAGAFVVTCHGFRQPVRIDPECTGECGDRSRFDQIAAAHVFSDAERERLHRTESVAPQESPVADQVSRNARPVVVSPEHRTDEFVIGPRLVGEAATPAIDGDYAGLAAVGHG